MSHAPLQSQRHRTLGLLYRIFDTSVVGYVLFFARKFHISIRGPSVRTALSLMPEVHCFSAIGPQKSRLLPIFSNRFEREVKSAFPSVRMCKRERLPLERIEGANVLSYLIEMDVQLQRVAAISDHLIGTLIEYFHPDELQLTSGHLMTMQVILLITQQFRQRVQRKFNEFNKKPQH